MQYNYLPGVQVQTIDGGLLTLQTPRTKSTITLGTSGRGPANTPYQVTDPNQAANDFGLSGTLYKAMQEVSTYCDNIILYRIGATAGTVSGIGAAGEAAGISITLGEISTSAGKDYSIWYASGVLYLWLNGTLVYSNDTAAVDSGDSVVTGTATAGLSLGARDDTAKTIYGAVSLLDACATPVGNNSSVGAPTLVLPVDGVSPALTQREIYVALDQAYDMLTDFPVQQAYCPNVVLDNPNVAFYTGATGSTGPSPIDTSVNNPVTNPDALDWLQTTTDEEGNATYAWASDGQKVWADAEERLADGYHEVNFGYQLARFAAAQSEVLGGCIGFIGCAGPGRFDLPTIRTWIGFLPTYSDLTTTLDGYGPATTAGKGLLGIPYLVGTTDAKLNPLCADYVDGHRIAGFYQTDSNEYDGAVQLDQNSNPIDIGAYLHVVGDTALISNNYGQYTGNVAGVACGLHAALDPKSAVTNKQLTSTVQLYKAGLGQLDSLTRAKVDMLRYKGAGQTPVLLHDRTAAGSNSDYIFLIRQDIKFLVCQVIFNRGNQWVGESSVDGLQMQAMQTAIDSDLQTLQKNGYISHYSFTVSTTQLQERVGVTNIAVKFMPADELVQLMATVGIQRS